jgi:hypothetical protein
MTIAHLDDHRQEPRLQIAPSDDPLSHLKRRGHMGDVTTDEHGKVGYLPIPGSRPRRWPEWLVILLGAGLCIGLVVVSVRYHTRQLRAHVELLELALSRCAAHAGELARECGR